MARIALIMLVLSGCARVEVLGHIQMPEGNTVIYTHGKTGLPLLGTLRFVDRWQYSPKTGELKFLSTDQISPDVETVRVPIPTLPVVP